MSGTRGGAEGRRSPEPGAHRSAASTSRTPAAWTSCPAWETAPPSPRGPGGRPHRGRIAREGGAVAPDLPSLRGPRLPSQAPDLPRGPRRHLPHSAGGFKYLLSGICFLGNRNYLGRIRAWGESLNLPNTPTASNPNGSHHASPSTAPGPPLGAPSRPRNPSRPGAGSQTSFLSLLRLEIGGSGSGSP